LTALLSTADTAVNLIFGMPESCHSKLAQHSTVSVASTVAGDECL